jgi:hypothetical protein
MNEIKRAKKEDKRSIVFSSKLPEELVEEFEGKGYTVRCFTVRERDKEPFKRTVIAWSK